MKGSDVASSGPFVFSFFVPTMPSLLAWRRRRAHWENKLVSEIRSELLTYAEGLVRRRGYSGFSYADLSERVGIRKASIHYYFPTKEVLVATVLQTYRDRYHRALEKIEIEYGNGLNRIEAYGRLYLTGVDKGLGCLCAALSAELEVLPADLKTGTVAFFREHLAWIDKIYTEGLHAGQVNARLKSSIIVLMRYVITSQWVQG